MTRVSIDGENFLIDGVPTYRGRVYHGSPIEGLLFNTRMVQATFDDENPPSRDNWAYPDTGVWDPDRNVREFIAALPSYRAHGVLAVTLNMQGGMPVVGTEWKQPWLNTAFTPDGALKAAYLDRIERVIRSCDAAGIVVILGYFYFGQDKTMSGADGIREGTRNATQWLLERGFENVLVEIDNECNVPEYTQILKLPQVHELIALARGIERDGRRMLVSTSITSSVYLEMPSQAAERVLAGSDFALLHTNGCDPERARLAVRRSATSRVPRGTDAPRHQRGLDAGREHAGDLPAAGAVGLLRPGPQQLP